MAEEGPGNGRFLRGELGGIALFKREDWIFGLISLALGAAVFLYSGSFNAVTSMDPSGPAAMPRIIAVMMILIGAIHVAASILIIKKNPAKAPQEKKGSASKVVAVCAACAIYYFLLERVGYLVMTPALIVAIMAVVGVRDVKKLLGMSIGTTAVLFCIFYFALKVNLPLGILEALFE
jgi:putative tricarboxylic transport membrane protein